MPTINPDRLLKDLQKLRSFGACKNGVVRLSFSEVDMQSRHWLVDRMNDMGLVARIDGVGNVFGRSREEGKALLMGSHSDTQKQGGCSTQCRRRRQGQPARPRETENTQPTRLRVSLCVF